VGIRGRLVVVVRAAEYGFERGLDEQVHVAAFGDATGVLGRLAQVVEDSEESVVEFALCELGSG